MFHGLKVFIPPRRRERVDPLLAFLLLVLISIVAYDYAVFPIRASMDQVPDANRPGSYRSCLQIHIDYRRGSLRIPGDRPAWRLEKDGQPYVVFHTARSGRP
ncbi:MAG: hypothetical protein IT210_24875 [Armatimonadetes bacterium]|nr:hypothetical protein [Armatimonadota bacterium]